MPVKILIQSALKKTDLHVLGASKKQLRAKQSPDKKAVPSANWNKLREDLKREEFEPKDLSSRVFRSLSKSPTLLVMAIERPEKASELELQERAQKLGAKIGKTALAISAASVKVNAKALGLQTKSELLSFCQALFLSDYCFDRYKSKKGRRKQFSISLSGAAKNFTKTDVQKAEKLADAVAFSRDLVNTPAKDCNPEHLVRVSKKIAKEGKLSVRVYDRKKLKEIGANTILAVSQGSSQGAYLIRLVYKPRGKKKSGRILSLVGKGITFDSGGLSIKLGASMYDMKGDMAGAAAVLGAMKAISQLKPNFEVRAYVPCCENMINGSAVKPGDVIQTLSGKTVEILNTDAEGRLILADALALAKKEKSTEIIDLATLTGACVVSLGFDYAGAFTKDEKLCSRLQSAAERAGEKIWPMPLVEDYRAQLKSPVADLKNIGGKWGGAITAGLFLSEFVGDVPWLHLDIAGPALRESANDYLPANGTGFGVSTLVAYATGN